MEKFQPIQFTPQCFTAGDLPIYLLSGEFHYFRVPKADWQRRMRLFKEAGGNCLATYIPWLLHEPQEGQFRFSGEDWLDLEGFLQAALAEGLYVITRPGPYQYSELVYHGLPGWLVRDYPETLALTASGDVIGYASVSYTHPVFLQKVQRWFEAVLPILARYTLANGGPIAFVQVDNETVGIHEWFGSLDYHPVTMGIGKPGGAYPRFLEQRYGALIGLNVAYEASFDSFAAVRPEPGADQSAPAQIRWRKDYFDFYLTTIADYFEILAGMLRAHGIDSPIMHNSGNPGMNAYFIEAAQRLEGQFMLGSDHYYNLDQNWAQNHPTPQYAAKSFLSLEMLRLMGFPPSVLEIPGGSASNWPPILPGDALAAYMTNLAFGMKGSNYYIFTGGPNPPGAGNTTDLYDYDASISAYGEVRPLYQAQKQFGKFVQEHPSWLTSKRLTDFRLGLNLEYMRSGQYWKGDDPFLFNNVDALTFLRTGVLTSALCASLSPEMINLDDLDWVSDTSSPLVIVSSSSMSARIQQKIVDFLNWGGKAVILPVLPQVDEQLSPCTILSDALGKPVQARNNRGLARPVIAGVVNVNGTTFPFAQMPAQCRVSGIDELSGETIALQVDTASGGQAVLLGLRWTHAMHEHEHLLANVLESLSLNRVVMKSNPNIWASAYSSSEGLTVFLMNLFTQPLETDLSVRVADKVIAGGTCTVNPVTVQVVEI